jgi:5'-3' exonuclease
MILLDNNQLIISNIFIAMKHSDIEDENILRHLCLNTYRMYNKKFKDKYGDIIICHDSPRCWRKDIFEHYKSNRKIAKAKSQHDWDKIFNTMTSIRKEVEENFHWKNVSVPKTEADDIIAVIVENSLPIEPVLILSSDKDFQQLQKYSNVKQWSPSKQDYLVCENPSEFLQTHIIRGDSSDGIPNILSDDDTFVNETKRQAPLTKKKASIITEDIESWKEKDNWKRNQEMIDFEYIPKEIKEAIMEEYNKPNEKTSNGIFNYLVQNKLVKLLEDAEDLY